MNLEERFLKYVSFDTQSQENSTTFPSTLKQHELANYLVDELHNLGIENASKDQYGYVYAKIEGTLPQTIGLIAHVDTALELTGANVKPRIIPSYDGSDITFPNGLKMTPADFPVLSTLKGCRLITTSGDTLLGADDKAGIAIIMTLVDKIRKQNAKYPSIFVCFTPDEETGDGTKFFNYDLYKVDFAYTLDGADIKYLNYECFNAATAIITINGKSIHPGEAKDKLVNSLEVAHEFHGMLPKMMKPEHTTGYEGFNHLNNVEGGVQQTTLHYIIRNHDFALFEEQKQEFLNISNALNQKYGDNTVQVQLIESYRNMKELIEPHHEIIDYPIEALRRHGITCEIVPIRGGTDGARLSYNGILCPNLGTGSYNHHGPFEIANITQMEQMVDVLITMLTEVIH